jgi:hypothetical protein
MASVRIAVPPRMFEDRLDRAGSTGHDQSAKSLHGRKATPGRLSGKLRLWMSGDPDDEEEDST